MKYYRPESIEQAMQLLSNCNARVIAGGTDLVLDLQGSCEKPDVLVDVTQIKELQGIREEGDRICIGAAVTHTEAAESEVLHKKAPALAAGCRRVGSRQIRNVATIAGNVVTAQPAADAAVPLAVTNPQFIIRTDSGIRRAGMEEMYAGFGKSTLDSTKELLLSIELDAEDEMEASAYERLELRSALALPMLCVAVRVRLNPEGTIDWVRIAMGPVGVGPVRASEAESYLRGKYPTEEVFSVAGEYALKNAKPRSNLLRGSREYRIDVLPTLTARALTRACQLIAAKRQED